MIKIYLYFYCVQTDSKMKRYVISQWINNEAILKGQAEELATNDKMAVFLLKGENILRSSQLEESHPAFLFLSKGKLSFKLNEEHIEIHAPAHLDFILIHPWSKMKTSKDFEGYFIMTEKSFFISISESIRSKFVGLIYQYAHRPFVPLNEQVVQRISLYINILINIITQPEYHFRNEALENMLRMFQLEIWNTVFNLYKNENTDEQHLWNDILSHFLHLVRTNCRFHHDVKWYATQLCVSSDALSAKTRRMYDKSASQIIDKYLLVEAKACLNNPIYSIQNVAELLSFSDQAAFYKFFKRCSGISPSQFKKEKNKKI